MTMTSREALAEAFDNFEKWATYAFALSLLEAGKVTRLDIYNAAHDVGIRPSVVDDRLRYFLNLGSELAAAKRELRETRARLGFTEKLEHRQFKEKRAALAVLSEIKELLSEGDEQ